MSPRDDGVDTTTDDSVDPASRFRHRIRDAGSWWDPLLLVSVPVVLVAVFTLPVDVKRRLALSYTDPTLFTAFASHFVHLSLKHLLVNLLGGVLVVPTGYLLSTLSDRRQQFVTAFVTFVFAFPFALSALNLVFVRSTISVGFSGIVLAFVGYLGIAVMDFAGEWYDVSVDGRQSAWLFFLALGLIALDISVYGPPIAVVCLLASVLFVIPVAPSIDRRGVERIRSLLLTDSGSELILFSLVVFLVYPAIAVTTTPGTPNGTINVYTHLLGFCLGYIVTYVTILLDRRH